MAQRRQEKCHSEPVEESNKTRSLQAVAQRRSRRDGLRHNLQSQRISPTLLIL